MHGELIVITFKYNAIFPSFPLKLTLPVFGMHRRLPDKLHIQKPCTFVVGIARILSHPNIPMLCMFPVKARILVHAIPIQSKVVPPPFLCTTRALRDFFSNDLGAALPGIIVLLVVNVNPVLALLNPLHPFHVVLKRSYSSARLR